MVDPKLCGYCGRYPSEHPHATCERHEEVSIHRQALELGTLHARLLMATQKAGHALLGRMLALQEKRSTPMSEQEKRTSAATLLDVFLRAATSVLPDNLPHIVVLSDRDVLSVSNVPPAQARQLLQMAIDAIDERGGKERYVEEL